MKAIFTESEYSLDAAQIYFDTEKQKGKSIDGITEFSYSHNTGDLIVEGPSKHVITTVQNIVYDHPNGQLLICPDLTKSQDVAEIIDNNLPLLRLQPDSTARNTINSRNFKTGRQLVRFLFFAVDKIVENRGRLYHKGPFSKEEIEAIHLTGEEV